jgi:hypothetical protein
MPAMKQENNEVQRAQRNTQLARRACSLSEALSLCFFVSLSLDAQAMPD